MDTFLGSLVQSRCGEGGMLQTNNTGVCSQCLTLLAGSHWACPHSRHMCSPCPHCSGSRLLHWDPSEAGPGLPVPLRLSHSGSGTQVVLGGADSIGLHRVPFPGPSSSGDQVFGEWGH